jgi:hypothetical protein
VAGGYPVKFRQDIVDIVRTAVADGTLADETRLDKLLDEIRDDFRFLDSTPPARK